MNFIQRYFYKKDSKKKAEADYYASRGYNQVSKQIVEPLRA